MVPRHLARCPLAVRLALVLALDWMLLGATLGCEPDLGASCDTSGCAAGASELFVTSEPEAPSDAVPSILRLHVVERQTDGSERAPTPLDPTKVVLVRGQLGRSQLAELARDEPSAALQARMVPALGWSGDDGQVVLAPTEALAPGEQYTVACAGAKLSAEISVSVDDPLPRLERLWPPLGQSASSSTAVWCGAAALPGRSVPTVLSPARLTGTLATGALEDGIGVQCLRFALPPPVEDAPRSEPGAGVASVAPPAWPSTGGSRSCGSILDRSPAMRRSRRWSPGPVPWVSWHSVRAARASRTTACCSTPRPHRCCGASSAAGSTW